MNRYSNITIRGIQGSKKVKITSKLKPEIISEMIVKWQSLIDATAKINNVPSALIMKLNEDSIEVFLKSNTAGNPYEAGEQAKLVYGLYCETVIGTQRKLVVPDATKDPVWKDNNPDIDLNMISYLGFPINWPDGEVFGTVCLLDNKENHYIETYSELLYHVKQHIETDLKLLCNNQELFKKTEQLEQLNNTKSRFLSLISHDIRGTVQAIDSFLKIILEQSDKFNKAELVEILKLLTQSTSSVYLTLESLLSWSKNDLLLLEANKTRINLAEIVDRAVNFFSLTINFKELEVVREYNNDNVTVIADEIMMETALRNIIANAIKYTKEKGKIFIRLYRKKDKNIIEIEDTGIGMDKNTLEKLFTYDRLKTIRGESGAGIGLLISREFLDKNNASVSVTSEIDKGTRFVISI